VRKYIRYPVSKSELRGYKEFDGFNAGSTVFKLYYDDQFKGGRSKSKKHIFIYTSQPQSTYEIMPLWNIYS